jgi:hypothetical protein
MLLEVYPSPFHEDLVFFAEEALVEKVDNEEADDGEPHKGIESGGGEGQTNGVQHSLAVGHRTAVVKLGVRQIEKRNEKKLDR